ncbi:MAG: CNNM domain-containing protein [Verrucomicrobiota bacterium]|nr:CNNM domain-containing protein [Verrucomicrobiota bacterium]
MSLAVSFCCSGMEAGVFALSRLRVRQQMRAGNRSAAVLHGFLENMEDFLWTVLLGNTLSNFVVMVLAVFLLHSALALHPIWLLAALIGSVFFLYAFADLLPKTLFRQQPTRFCLSLAMPFRLLHLGLSPAVRVLARMSGLLLRITGGSRYTGQLFANREEFRQLMQESSRAISGVEQAIINRVLDLQNLTVGSLTLPIEKAVVATRDTPVAQVLKLCRERNLTRLPLTDPGTGKVVGIFSLRASLYQKGFDPNLKAEAYLQPALYLPESMRLESALRQFRQSGQRLAIVLDRNRREVGIVTFQDVLRFLVGDISI